MNGNPAQITGPNRLKQPVCKSQIATASHQSENHRWRFARSTRRRDRQRGEYQHPSVVAADFTGCFRRYQQTRWTAAISGSSPKSE